MWLWWRRARVVGLSIEVGRGISELQEERGLLEGGRKTSIYPVVWHASVMLEGNSLHLWGMGREGEPAALFREHNLKSYKADSWACLVVGCGED